MPKKFRPKRPLKTVIDNMRQVRSIQLVEDHHAITKDGQASGHHHAEIRLAVWNVWKGSGGEAFEKEFKEIAAKSDLLLCQEALLTPRTMDLLKLDGFEWIHATSYVRADGHRDGVLTASRLESDGQEKRILCKFPEPVFKTPKAALVTMYKVKGFAEPLMVINIHARLIRRIENAMDEILHIIESLPKHHGPIIFAGDFNTFFPGYLRVISKVLKSHGLLHVPVPNDPRPSLGALDQIFVRGIDVKNISVDTSILGSDHFPIIVKAEVKKAG